MTIEKVLLPVGRIVGGHPLRTETKTNMKTKQPILKDGKEVSEWRCKIAIPKDQFMQNVWPLLVREASLLHPEIAQGVYPPDYSWKYVDGDSPQTPKGSKIPYNQREGYPGHYVITIATEAFMPSVHKYENGAYRQLAEHELKCGDYVVANVTIKPHNTSDGGLYINPNGFELVGYGTEINYVGMSNPNDLFGGKTYQLPQGASSIPASSAPAGVQMPMMAPQPQQQYAPAPMMAPQPQQQYAPAPMMAPQPQLPAPAHDFVQNVTGVPQQGFTQPAAPAVYQQPPVPQMQGGTVPGVTSYPTNGIPPLPQR